MIPRFSQLDKKKMIINLISGDKGFYYASTVTLNMEEKKIICKPFITNKYNWNRINYHQENMIGKTLKKIM